MDKRKVILDDNGDSSNGFRFEAELIDTHTCGFGDTAEEALHDLSLKLGTHGEEAFTIVDRAVTK